MCTFAFGTHKGLVLDADMIEPIIGCRLAVSTLFVC